MSASHPHAIVERLPGAWTGITSPPCHLCSWAWHGDRMEVKYANSACPDHGSGMSLDGLVTADVKGQEAEDDGNRPGTA